MKFDIKRAVEQIKDVLLESNRRAYTQPSLDWMTYETALVAHAGLPDRPRTIAYTLGIRAGIEHHLHAKAAIPPFEITSRAFRDYQLGFDDARTVRAAADDARTAAVFASIFGGA